MALLLFASRALLVSLGQEMLRRLRDAAAARLLAARLSALRRHATGDLLSRVFVDASMLSGFGENLLRRLVGDGLLAAGAVAMMFVLAPRLALIACVVAPLVALLLGALGETIRRRGARAQARAGALSALLAEQLRGVTAIRGTGAERDEAERFAASDAAYVRAVLRAETGASLLISAVFAAAAAGFLLAVSAGGRALAAGSLSPGTLLAFCLYAGQTVEPLRRLAEVHGLMQRALAAADRLFEVLDLPIEACASRPARGTAPLRGALRLREVRFRYQRELPLLEGIDLEIAEGERLGLAAATGSGKSTLARLIVRLEEPQGGRILLGGIDLAEVPLADLRRAVHVVEPEPFVFSGSLLANVRLGSPGCSRTRAADAVERAGLSPLLSALPGGLDGEVGETARLLSTGEKQRVALARALLADPALLVLDEATSALDVETEDAVFFAIDPWLAARTVLVVSHRLGTLARCPRVALLLAGRIARIGPPAEIAALAGGSGPGDIVPATFSDYEAFPKEER